MSNCLIILRTHVQVKLLFPKKYLAPFKMNDGNHSPCRNMDLLNVQLVEEAVQNPLRDFEFINHPASKTV